MKRTEIAVIGGGPAGLRAAAGAAALGARVTLIDRGLKLGGQLVKQTHKFFGSE
ncbi:MAG: FAD-dependent oxidoreductase, partial [Actinobacteria bacterium]|nr:FAD-dependent oxidoreductase [Actinomycetota bacterium]